MRKDIAYRSGSTLPVFGASQSRYTPFAVNSPVKFIGGPIDCGSVVVVVLLVVVVLVVVVEVVVVVVTTVVVVVVPVVSS
jgi:hypothetical protein